MQTAQLLEAFDALPDEEKRLFTMEFLRRAIPFDSGPLDDEETAQAADRLFDELDAEERVILTRGEIWLFDLGMAAKVRPVLVVSRGYGDADRALVTIVPHTTSLRGSQYEIPVNVPFLKPGAFLVQNVATYPNARAIRRLGTLKPEQFDLVFQGLLRWLGHATP